MMFCCVDFAASFIAFTPLQTQCVRNIRCTKFPQLVEELFSIPWGHHRYIIDKCKDVDKALFFVRKIHENNWSRDVLLNFLSTDLYEREGKAVNNFEVA